MFELLKDKLSSFASKLKKKAEEKLEKKPKPEKALEEKPVEDEVVKEKPSFFEKPPERPVEELVVPEIKRKPPEKPVPPKPKPLPEKKPEPLKPALERKPIPKPKKPVTELIEKRIKRVEEALEKKPEKKPVEKIQPKEAAVKKPAPKEKPVKKPVEKKTPEEKIAEKPREEEFRLKKVSELLKETAQPQEQPMEIPPIQKPPEATKPVEEEKRELRAKVGAVGALKGAIRGYTELRESDIADLLFELELSLLEADVNHETATALIKKIKELLLKERIPRGIQIDEFLKQKIKQALIELTKTEKIDLFELIEHSPKPFKILFLGPNGAGKTTTIAKLSFALQLMGKTIIWAAADTFRAASIEQLEEHAKKLKIRVVKHKYGADPTAVAFDAVKAAEANNIDVVMIDSAGRQETNRNLIEELKKLERVIKPNLKIFVGEAFAGKNLIEQARAFDEALNLDAFILTKIDTDPKGGTVISLLYELKKPVLFIGTGQAYKDLIPFTQKFIIDRII